MHLLFLSNYYNHHQKPVCERWDQLTEHDFLFVETEQFSDERKQLGWTRDSATPFVAQLTGDNQHIVSDIDNADYVIFGSAPMQLVENRLKDHKIVFKYSERVFKHGYDYRKWLPRLLTYRRLYSRHKTLYLLASSAYASADFSMHGAFRGKSYKWGYFPETRHYDISALVSSKDKNRILWCGRFLDWKHPDDAIAIASGLKAEGYSFELDIIGDGELRGRLEKDITALGLEDNVRMLGTMSPGEVRNYMEQSGIYLFTSDFGEGWGAVLNESMNSGCALVASHAAGSVPFLIKHRENGLIYKSGDRDGLYAAVKYLLDHPSEQERLGREAYFTISELWNADVAAQRFLVLAEQIKDHGYCNLFEDGPCSRAVPLKNNWFR